ncbi:MAG: hypothetical protein J2O49_02335, partial [Sciscionella sp.]|nr:hypothetical protein [Sciscionella sp.]
LREFVPSATVALPLRDDVDAKREITLGTVLPMAAAAIVRDESSALLGMQVQAHSADIGRDVAAAIRWALSASPGESLPVAEGTGNADVPPLVELIDPDTELDPLLHKDFSWWLPDGSEPSGEVGVALERANAAIMPTERLTADGVRAAYWVDAGEKAHLRWVRPEPEEQLLAALARLSVLGELTLGENSRYAGSFRAHGVLVPVWDLDPEMHAREWAEPARRFAGRLTDALGSVADQPLTEQERRARDGLRGRQVTLR